MGPNAVALIGSPPEVLRNGDSHYPFRASSDLFYLTGFAEPETTVLLRSEGKAALTMFVRPRDPEREIWDGRRAGVEGAKAQFGADQAFPSAELRSRLKTLIANADTLYYALGSNPFYDELVLDALRELRRMERRNLRPPLKVVDPRLTLHELRLKKSSEEVEVLRKAAAITCEAHVEAMRRAKAGVNECEIEALLNYTFRRHGGSGPGYGSIVGGGGNGTILHYIENNAELNDGDLLLIDAGCEFGHYTADVTRTFPVSGRFTEAQKRCYEIVLKAQEEAVAMTKPGATLEQIHERCVEILTAGMIELGLLSGTVAECIESGAFRQFYMHRTSHWLGLDVHDVGVYTDGDPSGTFTPRPLEPGMVITVEPGLYIAEDAEVAEEFRGIGIRIEDDLLVTASGCENLTAAAPKSVAEVEAACAS